jgi:hypothetical protein
MIADSKREAAKSLSGPDAVRPKTLKELEEYTEAKRKAVVGADPIAKKTNALVQKTIERN